MNNVNELGNGGITWTETTLKSIKETNLLKKIKKMKKATFSQILHKHDSKLRNRAIISSKLTIIIFK